MVVNINIWEFYIGDYVSIIDNNGKEYMGTIVCLLGADEVDEGEDYLALSSDGRQIGFYKREIKDIKSAQTLKRATG